MSACLLNNIVAVELITNSFMFYLYKKSRPGLIESLIKSYHVRGERCPRDGLVPSPPFDVSGRGDDSAGSPGEGAVGLRCLASAYPAVWENSVCSQPRPDVVPLASTIPSHVHGAFQLVMGHMHVLLPHNSPTTCKGGLHVTRGQSLGLLTFPVSSRLITFPSVSPILPPSLLPGSFQGTPL